MDQDEFRKTYRDVNERFCAFEKSILTNQCGCSQAERFCIAEREGVHCHSDEGQQRCLELLQILRDQARFALRTDTETGRGLPHGKAIRVQVGGTRGIAAALAETGSEPQAVKDVFGLLKQALAQFGSLEKLPFSGIMQHIAAYQGRKRTRRHKK